MNGPKNLKYILINIQFNFKYIIANILNVAKNLCNNDANSIVDCNKH